MNTHIWGQLRMERRGHHATLAHEHWYAVVLCENLDAFTNPFHTRGPNEYCMEFLSESHDAEITFETVNLSPIGIAPHVDIKRGK